MSGTLKYVLVIGLAFICCSQANAGDNRGRDIDYQIGFSQNLNSYQWMTVFELSRQVFQKGSLLIKENFNSSLIRLSRENNKWRDDQKLGLKLIYPFSSSWGIYYTVNAAQFSDKFSGLASHIQTNSSMAGFFFIPKPKIRFNAAAGFKYDRRLNKSDKGATYQIDISTDTLSLKEYQNQFFLLTRGDQYGVRQNNDWQFTYRVKKYFHQGTFDSLAVFWIKKRRDNYDQITIREIFTESLQEENKGFAHVLGYGYRQGLSFKLKTMINNRRTKVEKFFENELIEDRSKSEFHSENVAGIYFNHKKIDLNCSLSYIIDDQKNQVPDSVKSSRFSKYFYYISPDFESSRISLSFFSRLKLSRSDTLKIKGAVSKFQYDTPENNPDDRDEFRMNFHLSQVHYFHPQLKFVLNGSVNLYHLVYIYSERSANNNWMRIFRLSPQVVFQVNDRLKIVQDTEVLANYVNYDYETGSSLSQIRSYVFRRFMLAHQINVRFTKRTEIVFYHKYEIEENGKLDWDQWTEVVLTNRENQWVRFSLIYKMEKRLTISPGLILFKRNEKNTNSFSLRRTLGGSSGSDVLSYGPVLNINYQPHERLVFSFSGIRRAVESPQKRRSYINFINLKLSWYY